MKFIKEKNKLLLTWLRTYFFSIAIHITALVLVTVLGNLRLQSALVNPVFYTIEFNNFSTTIDEFETEKDEVIEESSQEQFIEEPSTQHFTFKDIIADTTNLDQLYKENTLNVSIRYPRGWTFVDQNVKNKLDGVTFWASDGLYNPPPYIHLEVKEKYYFNEQRYKYQVEYDNYTAYYNDPEIIENYYIQNVYLRTKTSEDFNIKLMMVGEDAFKSFQPRFFGMIKSFNFGSSFF